MRKGSDAGRTRVSAVPIRFVKCPLASPICLTSLRMSLYLGGLRLLVLRVSSSWRRFRLRSNRHPSPVHRVRLLNYADCSLLRAWEIAKRAVRTEGFCPL
jgi:hypothetical protein